MRKFILLLSLSLFSTICNAAAPTEESIDTLLSITNVEAEVDSMYANMEQTMRQEMEHRLAGKQISSEQQRALDAALNRSIANMREELSWARLRPLYIKNYQKIFTQAQVDSMIDFYRSPAGAESVNQIPSAMKKIQAGNRKQLDPFAKKIQAALDQAFAEAKIDK
jgi:hypothetical protein